MTKTPRENEGVDTGEGAGGEVVEGEVQIAKAEDIEVEDGGPR